MKRVAWVFSCLFLFLGSQAQDWSKVKVGQKLTVFFPKQPSVENTPVGPQAQFMDSDSTRYTVLVMDLSKDGVDSATLNAQMREGFEEFARQLAMQGGVEVSKVVRTTWHSNNYPVAEVSGHNDTRDVEFRMILMGSDIVIMAYSASRDRASVANRNRFFQSLLYTYNPLKLVSKET